MDRGEVSSIGDRIDLARAEAFLATLGRPAELAPGAPLPPFAHHAFFWSPVPEAELGPDGHERPGGPIPDTGLPVRMYGGGRLILHAPFRAGVQAERASRVVSVTRKEGRTGALALVTLRHEVRQRAQPVLTEEQVLIYRAEAVPGEPVAVTAEPDERRALKLTAVSLFRYSALTFNAHRIHYDADYVRDLGHPGLIVHGPLLATRLALWAAERGPLAEFAFRAVSPLYLGDVAWLCRKGAQYWVEGPKRRLCMEADAA